jgi:S1-C subfamily serine protease
MSLLQQLSDEFVALLAGVTPSVVALAGTGKEGEVTGSGFLIDDAGHAVTNFHVVEGLATPITVTIAGGTAQPAALVGTDPLTDLAVIKVETPPGPFLPTRVEPARLGELCLALGSPFGIYPESVALGVVSGLARTIHRGGVRPIDHAIQTDAAINPGNSGGPLVDVRGFVIGVNQCVDTRAENIGFAIPADTLRAVAAELIAHGNVERAALGVSVAKQRVMVDGADRVGLRVTRVGRPLERGDALLVGDVLLAVGEEDVDEPGDLYRILTRDRIDAATPVRVLRGAAIHALTVHPARLGAG